jgi:zinc protease
MAIIKKILIAFFLLVSLPAWSLEKEPISKSFFLDNGMQVIVIENHIVPAVTQMVVYKIGAAHEKKGKSGIAHVLEHMLFKSTDKLKSGEFSKIVAQYGGNDNAYTTKDFTAYHQSISKDKLELVMEMEADRMKNLNFTQEEFDKEIQVVLEERNMRIENSPRNVLIEKMQTALFENHPYGTQVIGLREDIENLSRPDAFNFYKKYYSPNNAILIVSGDITIDEIKPLAEKYYGTISKQEIDKTKVPTKLPTKYWSKTVKHSDSKVQGAEIIYYYEVPSLNTDKSEYGYPLVLLSHILGSGNTSILYQSLVIKQEIAAYSGANYDDISLGPSIFSIHIIPNQNISLERVEKLFDKEIKNLIEKGINKNDLERAKNELITAAIYARDGISPMANIYGTVVGTGISPEYINNWGDNLNSVSIEDINNAIELVFNESPKIIGKLLPKK